MVHVSWGGGVEVLGGSCCVLVSCVVLRVFRVRTCLCCVCVLCVLAVAFYHPFVSSRFVSSHLVSCRLISLPCCVAVSAHAISSQRRKALAASSSRAARVSNASCP